MRRSLAPGWIGAALLIGGCAGVPPAEGPGPPAPAVPAPAAAPEPLPDIASLWDFDDPTATRQRMEAVLPRAADRDGYRLELLTQIARTHGVEGGFDAAHAALDRVEAELDGAPPRVGVLYLLERGRAFRSAGERERALPLFVQAWDRARAEGIEPLAVDAAHMAAIAERGDARLQWNLRALEYAEGATDPSARRWLGALYNNIGWDHHDAGRYAEALDLWEKGLAWRVASGAPASSVLVARWTVARALRSLGHFDEALARQRDLLADHETAERPAGFVLEEIGECLLALGRRSEAQSYFARAHDALSRDRWLSEHEPQRLERLRRLAGLE